MQEFMDRGQTWVEAFPGQERIANLKVASSRHRRFLALVADNYGRLKLGSVGGGEFSIPPQSHGPGLAQTLMPRILPNGDQSNDRA
jgi:hypothetical protein